MQPQLAGAAGEFFVHHLAIKGDDARLQVFQFLRQEDAAFGKFLALDFLDGAGRALDQVGHADAEFQDAAVVFVAERLGDHARFVHDRPELIAAAGVVVADAGGTVARIGADQNHSHTFAKIIRQCAHSVPLNFRPGRACRGVSQQSDYPPALGQTASVVERVLLGLRCCRSQFRAGTAEFCGAKSLKFGDLPRALFRAAAAEGAICANLKGS